MALSTIRAAILLFSLAVSAPLAAQSLEQLDALSDQTADEATGIATAREQVSRGELLEALATLERVLTVFPESDEARFFHAVTLCWIDDPQGADVEFARLDEDDYAPGTLQQARDNCRAATEGEQQ